MCIKEEEREKKTKEIPKKLEIFKRKYAGIH